MRYKLVKMEINVDNINWPYSGGIHNIFHAGNEGESGK